MKMNEFITWRQKHETLNTKETMVEGIIRQDIMENG
jgi:hypothetical protein